MLKKYNMDIEIHTMGNRHNLYTHGKKINKNDQIYTQIHVFIEYKKKIDYL